MPPLPSELLLPTFERLSVSKVAPLAITTFWVKLFALLLATRVPVPVAQNSCPPEVIAPVNVAVVPAAAEKFA